MKPFQKNKKEKKKEKEKRQSTQSKTNVYGMVGQRKMHSISSTVNLMKIINRNTKKDGTRFNQEKKYH